MAAASPMVVFGLDRRGIDLDAARAPARCACDLTSDRRAAATSLAEHFIATAAANRR